jgi:DNA invertase Pin-like site-specific DNA recombinase
MKVGYIRVSKQEQNEALQRDALKAHGMRNEIPQAEKRPLGS